MKASTPKDRLHGTSFLRILAGDGWMQITVLLFLVTGLIQVGALGVILWSRFHFGMEFNPTVFSAFQEKSSAISVNDTLGISDAIAAREASRAPIQDEISDALKRADQELLMSREEQGRSASLQQDAEKKADFFTRQSSIYWEKGSRELAMSCLHQALQAVPDHLSATRQLARFYEESHNFTQARFQWEKVAAIVGGQSQELVEIRKNIQRLEQLKSAPEELQILKVTRTDLPLEDLYDLRFSMQVVLKSTAAEPRHDVQQIRVEVVFYDQSHTAQGILIPIKVLDTSLRPKQAWNVNGEQMVSLTYSVPQGYFRSRGQTFGKTYAFCGYIVRVYYRGMLLDVQTYPSHILKKYA